MELVLVSGSGLVLAAEQQRTEEMAQVHALDLSASCVYFLHLGGGSPTP